MKMIVITLQVKTDQLEVQVVQSFAIHLPLPLMTHFSIKIALQGKGGAISAENGVIVFRGTNYFFK